MRVMLQWIPIITGKARKKYLGVGGALLVCLGAIGWIAMSAEDHRRRSEDVQREFYFDRQALDVAAGGPLAEFDLVVERMGQKWKSRDPACYGRLMAYASGLLAGRSHGRNGDVVAEQIAIRTLSSGANVPIDVQMDLARQLRIVPSFLETDRPTRQEIEADRRQKASLALDVWERFEKAIDRSYSPDNPKYRVYRNLAPPAWGGGHASGMDPADIPNRAARDIYKAAIEKNRQVIAASNLQAKLKSEDPDFPDAMAAYLIELYRQRGADPQQLDGIVEGRAIPEAARAHLFREVLGAAAQPGAGG